MAVVTVNKDGSVTVTTEDEDGGPTGAVESTGPVTTEFDAKVVASGSTESKTVKKSSKK